MERRGGEVSEGPAKEVDCLEAPTFLWEYGAHTVISRAHERQSNCEPDNRISIGFLSDS